MEKDLSRINELTGTATVLNAIFSRTALAKLYHHTWVWDSMHHPGQYCPSPI